MIIFTYISLIICKANNIAWFQKRKFSTGQRQAVQKISRLLYKIQLKWQSQRQSRQQSHVASKTATAAMMVLREPDTGLTSGAITANVAEAHRPRNSGPMLRQTSFHWKALDKYVEILSFEMKVTNMLQVRTYKLNDEERSISWKHG